MLFRVSFLVIMLLQIPNANGVNISDVFLPEGRTNGCYELDTLKDQAECSTALFESYYTEWFTKHCPNFGINVADWKCVGCPWDRVDPDVITPKIASELNKSIIFHPTSPTCLISDLVVRFNRSSIIDFYTRYHATVGIILPAFVNILTFYADNQGRPRTPSVLGWTPSETLFIFSVMVLFYVGTAFSATARVYLLMCELPHDESPVQITVTANYIVMLVAMVWRWLHLHAHTIHRDTNSWATFLTSKMNVAPWKRYVSLGICGGLPAVYGHRNVSYGAIIYASLVSQVSVTTIYSTGPPRQKQLFLLRYVALCSCLGISTLLFILRFSNLFRATSTSMLVDPIPDKTFDYGIVGFAYICFVALLGIA